MQFWVMHRSMLQHQHLSSSLGNCKTCDQLRTYIEKLQDVLDNNIVLLLASLVV